MRGGVLRMPKCRSRSGEHFPVCPFARNVPRQTPPPRGDPADNTTTARRQNTCAALRRGSTEASTKREHETISRREPCAAGRWANAKREHETISRREPRAAGRRATAKREHEAIPRREPRAAGDARTRNMNTEFRVPKTASRERGTRNTILPRRTGDPL